MKKQPPYINNPQGACLPYAVANLTHFVKVDETQEGGIGEMLDLYPPIPEGYLIGEIDTMLKIIDSNAELLPDIMYYDRDGAVTKKQFYKFSKLWEISEYLKLKFDEEFFIGFIFFIYVYGKNEEGETVKSEHALSGYISLDNFTMIIMDSSGEGYLNLIELEAFFNAFEVYGVVQLGIENNNRRIPYVIPRNELQIWR